MSEGPRSTTEPFLDPQSKAGIGQVAGFLMLIAGSVATRSGFDARLWFLVGGATLLVSTLARIWPLLRPNAE